MKLARKIKLKAGVARDISYASSAVTRPGRAVIRTLENVTGRPKLIRRANGYDDDVAAGMDFWQVMVDRYGVKLDFKGGSLDNLPKEGPLVVVANHPFGILDGLIFGHILQQVRGDFRIIAHRVFRKAEDLNKVILPISFDGTREAMKVNTETRKEAIRYLNDGGCIGIFPGGTVSTAVRPFGQPIDPVWRNFTARMIQKTEANVVPIFFEGSNSRLFQVASHLHYTLRMSLMIREFKKGIKKSVPMVIGESLPRSEINAHAQDATELMAYLRRKTYELSPIPLTDLSHGYEFEEQYR
ncbi:MAG: lysophospholipid acyltransferase family protein [Pseudomonadota bacterium]